MTVPDLRETNLFKPIKVGNVDLTTRVTFAPTTRTRATDDFVPSQLQLQYYGDRSENNGGLIITEATFVSKQGGLYENVPGIWSERQAKAWRTITDKVHHNNTAISVQLWNLGRVASPKLAKEHGLKLLGPSAIYENEASEKAAQEAGIEIQAATIEDIENFKKEYVVAAKLATEVAGFDFIEVHSAHGYLFDQFLQGKGVNERTDQYGGTIENRARFLLEVIDLLIDTVGAEKLAIRLSPWADVQGSGGVNGDPHPIVLYGYVLSELEKRAHQGNRLAYVSIVEPRVNGVTDVSDEEAVEKGIANNDFILDIWKGVVVRSGAYLSSPGYPNLIKDVNANDRTLIGAGRFWTSNPDLVQRLKNGQKLTPYDRSTFYLDTNYGYNTWREYGDDTVVSEDDPESKKTPVALA
ncbi:BA75_00402T0 [Komagataella pastoris]|uniref:Probable NADPH dehydrogenase n=1 Tax=Komagataella pastoris TaxID=4922 RepID=A0A1B2JAC9_PICPA|nr:BA75_00402T0 [Komagataella pastoris]